MAVNLTKGQTVSLQKNNGTHLTHIMLGAGWDMEKSKGLLGFFGGGSNIDLDLSAILFDANKVVVDSVYFGHLRSIDGSIIHQGDNLTGEGDGDDEIITVNLTQVDSRVTDIVFTISSFRGQTFEKVKNAFCRIVDATTGEETARYDLSASGNYTSLIVAKLTKTGDIWHMVALGEKAQGKQIKDLAPIIRQNFV